MRTPVRGDEPQMARRIADKDPPSRTRDALISPGVEEVVTTSERQRKDGSNILGARVRLKCQRTLIETGKGKPETGKTGIKIAANIFCQDRRQPLGRLGALS
jgi:hypothetical protein